MHAIFSRPLSWLLFLLPAGATCFAQPETVSLPPAQTRGGKPLMEALQQRQTLREFKPDAVPLQTLADLLWAGYGINRPGTGRRTAPSAMNTQEVDIYIALREGVYLYQPQHQSLKLVSARDIRAQTGGGDFAKVAPVNLIYVADLSRFNQAEPESRRFYAAFDAGCISQNVYLYCASAGLATVVHELDRKPLIAALNLKPDQQIILAQAVGFSKAGAATEPAK